MELKRVALSNGETYAYREAGGGDKILVLVHGNSSSSIWWDLVIEQLEDKFKIYAPDIRGFGDSSYNTPIKTMQDPAEDLKLFADALGIKDFAIAGWSLGGPMVMKLAIHYPEYVSRLILLESGSVKGLAVPKTNFFRQPIPGKYLTTREDVEKFDRIIVNAYAKKRIWLLKYAFNKTVFNLNKPEPKRYQIYLEAACQQRNKVDVDFALINFNISHQHNGVVPGTGEVDKINCPVLVLNGDKDLLATMDMAETTVKEIGDNARLVVLNNAAHGATVDRLDKIIEEIINFVK